MGLEQIDRLSLALRKELPQAMIASVVKRVNPRLTHIIQTQVRRDGLPVTFTGELVKNTRLVAVNNGVKFVSPPYYDRLDEGYVNPAEPISTSKFVQWYVERFGKSKSIGKTSSVNIPAYNFTVRAVKSAAPEIQKDFEQVVTRITNKVTS